MGVVAGLSQVTRSYRADFPIFGREVNGRPLAYLDTAASAQKPRAVLDAMHEAYAYHYANVHRGVHTLGYEATAAFEAARGTVAHTINARSADEVVFVRGATEGINLLAASFGSRLVAGDAVVISELEHHANIVPWQMLREKCGIDLRIAPIGDDGALCLERFAALLTPGVRLVAVTHVSNVLGTVVPVSEVIRRAHACGSLVLIDGCQAIGHRSVDVRELDADFYVFSGHKAYGPTGIGVLWGKREILETLPPWQEGGEMIESVSFARTTFKKPTYRFEAGTPAIVEAIGLAAALEYVFAIGVPWIEAHERALTTYAIERLGRIDGVRVLPGGTGQAGILSFEMAGVHPHDIATVIDRSGVAVRAGHHCAQPLMSRLGVTATVRASVGLYTHEGDIDALADGLGCVREMFG
ncbi:MAG: SufS family cysteine desulfurase [Rhodospirillales bacterium]|nr:SufS family cysteine desulfurase [Rhodospirillales bacterium]